MKILMLPTWFGGISWWRFEVPAKALKAAGHEVYCAGHKEVYEGASKYKGDPMKWLEDIVPNYDLIHTGYSADPVYGSALFQYRDKYNIPIITDIDDDLDNVPTYNSGWRSFHPGTRTQRIVKTQLTYSDAISFSTEPLATSLGYLAKDKSSAVLQNWIDVNSWDHPTAPDRSKDKSIRLLITGGSGRYGDWEIFREPLEWALKHYDGNSTPTLRVFFIGGTPDWVLPYMSDKQNARNNRVFYVQPAPTVTLFNRLVRYISPDIVISPTIKNEFNRSKSGLKYLEASLAGAAFLCTDWPTYSVAPKGCCLRADNTPTQWKESLAALIEDPALRGQLVEKAREHVLDSCLAEQHIQQRVQFYEEVISARRAKDCQVSLATTSAVPTSAQEASL